MASSHLKFGRARATTGVGALDQNAPRLLLVTLFAYFAIDLAPYLPKESKYVNHNCKFLISATLGSIDLKNVKYLRFSKTVILFEPRESPDIILQQNPMF